MTKLIKILLGLSLICLAIGVFVAHSNFHFPLIMMVLLPAGAIFLGLFLIFKILAKETAAFDAEQRAKEIPDERPVSAQAGAKHGAGAGLTHAPSH
jgi:hypothetical protein